MKFSTQIPLTKTQNQIDYSSQLLIMGSCFAENIGRKLNFFKFQHVQNPFGILFHPLAIEKLISKAIHQEVYEEKDVFHLNERYHCFDAHSELSNPSKEKIITHLNESVDRTNAQLKKASHVIITLGTAWVYRSIKNGQVVANCHKVLQAEFAKELLGIDTIVESIENSIAMVSRINPGVQFIFTVSPVRHLKDGFVENQLSKAHLISAVHEIVKNANALYFPSYEMMMDELRDYRFYAKDMIHPNETAIDYIWDKFCATWISDSALVTMDKVAEIQRGLLHRPFNASSEQHKKFLKSIEEKIAYIKKDYPFIDFNSKEV